MPKPFATRLEVMSQLAISRPSLDALVEEGFLSPIKIGNDTVFECDEIALWQATLIICARREACQKWIKAKKKK
jgi:hypothetical protein